MILVAFNSGCTSAQNTYGLWKYDYGQKLRIQGLDLPTAVEVHFSFSDTKGDSVTRVGVTRDGVTDVPIPDSFLENSDTAKDYPIYAFIYLTDETSGQTEYKITMRVKARPKPEAFDTPEEAELFRDAIAVVNEAADRAGVSEGNAKESEDKSAAYLEATGELARQVASNTTKVEKYAEQTAKDAEIVKTASEQVAADKATVEKVVETAVERVTPSIGENGNWFIDGKDTGKPSGGVSSWNDLPDRPFYETTELSVILPEATYHQTVADDGAYIDANFTIEVGKTYTVIINGKSRECVAITFQGIANEEPVDLPALPLDDRGSSIVWFPPVLRHAFGGHVAHVIIIGSGSSTFTMSILGEVPKVVTIDPKYIKDMYYTEGSEGSVIFPETTATNITRDDEPTPNELCYIASEGFLLYNGEFPLVGDTVYSVKLNGVEYTCKSQKITLENITAVAIGDLYTMSEGTLGSAPTGEPFALLCGNGMMQGVVFDQPAEVTLSISGGEIVHKLNNKYLDLEWLPIKTRKRATLFDDTVSFSSSGRYSFEHVPFEIIAGETYTIVFDNVSYESVAKAIEINTNELYMLGNHALINSNNEDTGEPFFYAYMFYGGVLFSCYFATSDNYKSKEVGISISGATIITNKMPLDFLPNEVTEPVTIADTNESSVLAAQYARKKNQRAVYGKSEVLFAEYSDAFGRNIAYIDKYGLHSEANGNKRTALMIEPSKVSAGKQLMVSGVDQNTGLITLVAVDAVTKEYVDELILGAIGGSY